MKALLVVVALIFLASIIVPIIYFICTYKERKQAKENFDRRFEQVQKDIDQFRQRPLRRSMSGGGSSSRTSNSSGSSAYDSSVSMLNIASISDSGGYSGGSSCSSSSSYSSSSSSSSSSCD